MRSLEIEGLTKSYAEQEVLRGLDLVVESGSFSAILGSSGSGKTTLLRVIAGFERADRGIIRVRGEVVDDVKHYVSTSQRRIGYVPQEGSLFPHLRVADNVAFGLPKARRHERQVSELLEMVGLSGLKRRYPHQLSGGQQQRVALARALAVRPSLVLLDEPFSSLDAGLRASVRADVRRVLRDAETTALLVTHDQDEALSLADHVAVLQNGRVAQYDTPEQLYARPATPELARSLGETNFVHGVAHGDSVETALGTLALDQDSPARSGQLLALVRPEQIVLVDASTPGAALGHVLDSEFYGHDVVVRIGVEGADPRPVIARRPRGEGIPPVGATIGFRVVGGVTGWTARTADVAPKNDEADAEVSAS